MEQRIKVNHPLFILASILFLALAVATTAAVFRAVDPKTPSAKLDKVPAKSAPKAPNDSELARLINEAIDTSEFAGARWGVYVVSSQDGHAVYARNSDQLFTPASNMKVYTTAVALDLLGADYRWRTSVYAAAAPDAKGVVSGDLVLYGRGAPDLTSRSNKEKPSSLAQLADALYERGVRRIRGDIIGDESYFRGEPLGDGWLWNDVQWYFGAEPSALSIDDNEVDVEVKPPDKSGAAPIVRLSREQADLQVTSEIANVKADEPLSVGIHRGLSDNKVHVWGEFPAGSRGFGARLAVHNPARLAASLFLTTLKAKGISIDGEAKTRDFRSPRSQRFDPSKAIELASVSSRPLAEIVKTTNKESVNLNAELILRTLGRERGVTTEEKTRERERGDDEIALDLIRGWLARNGVASQNLGLHDGSGLSRLDLVTPEATVGLLQGIMKTQSAYAFRDSLPQAGTDGTLRGRLREYKDRVFAKTGSLTYDNSLSGFLTSPDGENLTFSIMANDQTGRASSTKLIDQIVTILADYTAKKPNQK
jgi:D-alanyl-D-alanine carboxypeptidase/D-alanyl-D-alanine-endopeptidase (penicillin-binding protein 4)